MIQALTSKVACLAALGATLAALFAPIAHAQQHNAGFQFRTVTTPVSASSTATQTIELAVWYPTQSTEKLLSFGPYSIEVAMNAPPLAARHPLVVVSHGYQGHHLNHHPIARALAKGGYVVVAPLHSGDNFADQSLVGTPAYVTARPRQISSVLDAALAEPFYANLIDANRIGFFGHSAGGLTGLALAGGRPSMAAAAAHCASAYDEDAWFCGVAGDRATASSRAKAVEKLVGTADTRDPRIKAFALSTPAGGFFSVAGLQAIDAKVLVYRAGQDQVLNPKFHTDPVVRHVKGAVVKNFSQAGHFMMMSKLAMQVVVNGTDVNADPPGQDRAETLAFAGRDLVTWFDQALK